MKSKQTSCSSKEILCFCVRYHDRLASIMQKCVVIIVVLMLSKDVGTQADQEVTINFHTTIANLDIVKDEISNIKIAPYYNITRNKILLNISWDQPTDWNKLRPYYFHITPNSTYAECKSKTKNVFDYMEKNLTSTSILLPPYFHSYDLIAGCTYIIDIAQYFQSQKETKSITYTLPECVATKCSCRYLTPKVTNLNVKEVTPKIFNISWEISNNWKKTPLNITNVILEYREYRPKSNGFLPFRHIVPRLSYEREYYIFNDTSKKFIEGEKYELQAFFTTIHNCKGSNLTSFIVNPKISDVKVNWFYYEARNKILLNISWDQAADWSNPHPYYFRIISNSAYAECKSRTKKDFHHVEKNLTLPNILLPPYLDPYDLIAGCSYIIDITQYFQSQKETKTVTYTLPECVATKCSCRHLTPQVINLKVAEVTPRIFNISWEIPNNRKKTPLNITNVILEYREYRPKSNGFQPFQHIVPRFSYKRDYYIFNDSSKKFTEGEKYELQAFLTTVRNCKGSNLTTFVGTKVKEEHVTRSSNAFEIALLVILLSFIMLAVIYLLRRNRLVVKELVLNPFALRFTRHGRQRQELRTSYVMVPTISKRQQEANPLYVEQEIVDGSTDRYEFPRTRIELIQEIGEGAFGEVYKARALTIRNQPGYTYVAVKKLREKATSEEMDDFLSEIEILKKVGEHPNVVSMFGCCILKEPYLMVMEFVPCGDLKHYLLDLREKWIRKKRSRSDSSAVFTDTSDGAYITPDSPRSRLTSEGRPSVTETEYTTIESEGYPTPTELYNDKIECNLDHTELQNFALQIARGMKHLEKIPIAHRDLAARNILINEFKTLKISDFGLSRIGPYVNTKKKKLPLRWMAIESIEDNFYDSKSDVWSFAVVLWEIGTLGAFPYDNVLDAMVPHYLASGKRLLRPEICTDELHSLMLRCWSQDPQLRPSFQELVELLDVKRRRIYVDFNQLNPLYVFPPSTLAENDKQSNIPVTNLPD